MLDFQKKTYYERESEPTQSRINILEESSFYENAYLSSSLLNIKSDRDTVSGKTRCWIFLIYFFMRMFSILWAQNKVSFTSTVLGWSRKFNFMGK